MALNTYFDNFSYYGEQELLQDLGSEMIQMFGVNIYYMPRSHVNIDKLYLEDTLSYFKDAIEIEVYIKTFQGWQGEGDLMTKFGISMADQITFSMMRRRFQEEVTNFQSDYIRPLEGDLIYLPLTKAIFEIKFVEHESNFYQTGQLSYYDIKCERFNYSSENISTGIDEIDIISDKYSNAEDEFFIVDQTGSNIIDGGGNDILEGQYTPDKIDATTQNDLFSKQSRNFVDFSKSNPFGEIV